jgi:hypothetical protein
MSALKTCLYICVIVLILLVVIYIIYSQMTGYYQQSDPMLKIIKDTLEPLHPRVRELNFYEGNKSYTINKRKIYLCLRDENQEYYDFNMLLYVAIHELSHVLCDEIGHTPKFNHIFQNQLIEAERQGIYDSSKPIISNYCGHN